MALPFDNERATKAVLSFIRKTKVGQVVTILPRDVELGEEDGEREGERERGRSPIGIVRVVCSSPRTRSVVVLLFLFFV